MREAEQKHSPVPAQGLSTLSVCCLSQLLLLYAFPLLSILCAREMLCLGLSVELEKKNVGG